MGGGLVVMDYGFSGGLFSSLALKLVGCDAETIWFLIMRSHSKHSFDLFAYCRNLRVWSIALILDGVAIALYPSNLFS
jgi:hypothetical protein